MKIKSIVAIAIIVLLGIIGFNYYNNSSHTEQSLVATKQDSAKLNDIVNRWEHNSAVASKASSTELPVVVKEMQSLRDETATLKVTTCLSIAKESLLVAMDAEIAGYLKLISDSDASITADMNNVYRAIKKHYEIVEECNA